MIPRKRSPTHPGGILKRHYLTTPELWLNLQRNYDLWHASHDSKAWQRARIIMSPSHPSAAAFAS